MKINNEELSKLISLNSNTYLEIESLSYIDCEGDFLDVGFGQNNINNKISFFLSKEQDVIMGNTLINHFNIRPNETVRMYYTAGDKSPFTTDSISFLYSFGRSVELDDRSN